jgi:hypothetical protein
MTPPEDKNFAAELSKDLAVNPLMQFDLRLKSIRITPAPDGGLYLDFPALGIEMELGFFRVNMPLAVTKKLFRLLQDN